MKKFLTIIAVGVFAFGLSSTVYANVCSFDAVPAATLLFPFVAYDYDGGTQGQTTIFSITNVSSEAQIVHITLWSDFSQAILDYNVVLTGYDVYRQNIRDILADGILPGPLTGDTTWATETVLNDAGIGAGTTPIGIGPVSATNEQWTTPPAGIGLPAAEATWDGVEYPTPDPPYTNPLYDALNCDPRGWLSSPNNYTFPIDPVSLGEFQRAFTASQTVPTSYGGCVDPLSCGDLNGLDNNWFLDRPAGPSWLYITADVVQNCNKDLPDSQADTYFAAATVSTENVLMGDVIWISADDRYSEADNAVHLEADVTIATTAVPPPFGGLTTFYRKHQGDASGAKIAALNDYREPLPSAWAFRFQYNEAAQINTWIRAWQGGTIFPIVQHLTVDPLYPNGPDELIAEAAIPYTYYSWDMDENVAAGGDVGGGGAPPWSGTQGPPPGAVPNLLPLETQEVSVSDFQIVGDGNAALGWMLFVFPRSNTFVTETGGPIDHYQTWMGVKYSGGGGDYTAARTAFEMGNYNCFSNQTIDNGLNLGAYTFNPPATE